MVWEAISNIRKGVLSDIAPFFQPLPGVWISDGTLFLVFDILLITTELLSTEWYKTKTESDPNDQSGQRKLSEFTKETSKIIQAN